MVDYRNDMAHATGNISIYSEEEFDLHIKLIYRTIVNINKTFEPHLKIMYISLISDYISNVDFTSSDDDYEYIYENVICDLNFSSSNINFISKTIITDIITRNRNQEKRIKDLKNNLNEYNIEIQKQFIK